MIPNRLPTHATTTGLLLAALALGFALRTWNLGSESLWQDEAHSIVQAQRWWKAIWVFGARDEPNPPLYFTLLKYWMKAFGASEAAVRSLSVLWGMVTILALHVFGRMSGGPALGLGAALLAATSPVLVVYSRDARGYALATAAATIALCGALRLLRDMHKAPEARAVSSATAAAAYACGSVVAIYTHTTLLMLPVVANVAFVAV